MKAARLASHGCDCPTCTNRGTLPTRGGDCIRCGSFFPAMSAERCPSAPDAGPHEAKQRIMQDVKGWSTHGPGCPRGVPSNPADVGCTCRTTTPDVGEQQAITAFLDVHPEYSETSPNLSALVAEWVEQMDPDIAIAELERGR